jgi:hypothetical protein
VLKKRPGSRWNSMGHLLGSIRDGTGKLLEDS